MKRLAALLLAMLPVAALAAPSPQPHAMHPVMSTRLGATVTGDHYTIRPPESWSLHKRDSPVRSDQWSPQGDASRESIEVVASTAVDSISDYLPSAIAKAKYLYGDDGVAQSRPEATCDGTRQGYYLEIREHAGSTNLIVEQMLDDGGGFVVAATYTRKAGMPRDPVAHASLATLCGKSLYGDES